MKVLMIYYPLKVHYNHGVFLLAEIMKRRGIEVAILELTPFINIKAIAKDFDFIGFSIVTSHEYNACLPFMVEAKKLGKPVMVGGVYVRRGSYIDPSAADYICRGEAEILPDFILNGDTTVFEKPYIHKDISSLPLPDLSRLSGFELDRDIPILKGLRIFPYHSSRGCPYKCTFCEVQFQPKRLIFRKTIRKDLEFLWNRHRPNLFYFMDEMIPYYNPEWCALFEGNPYPFICYIRCDLAAEQLEWLIRNGMKAAAFGIESGDETYRNEVWKKGVTDEDIYRTTAILRTHGLPYFPFYIINGPHETETIRAKTIGMARGLGGFPQFHSYEDLSKRVFDISDERIKKYSKKVTGDEAIIRRNINDTSHYVYADHEGFLVYKFTLDGMWITEFMGSGKKWQDRIEDFAKEYDVHKYMGRMSRPNPGFQRRYNLTSFGNLIGREI